MYSIYLYFRKYCILKYLEIVVFLFTSKQSELLVSLLTSLDMLGIQQDSC